MLPFLQTYRPFVLEESEVTIFGISVFMSLVKTLIQHLWHMIVRIDKLGSEERGVLIDLFVISDYIPFNFILFFLSPINRLYLLA